MKRKIIIFSFIIIAFSLLCVTTYAAVTGTGNTITGEAVAGATVYELYTVDETGYTLVDESPALDFDVSGFGVGEWVFAVRAKGDGYLPSDYSNEVYYTVSADEEETVYYNVTYNENDHGQILCNSFTVKEGNSFSGTISPYSGYGLPSVIYVTMNGVDLIEGYGFTYDSATGAFTVNSVTGDLYITYDAPPITSSAPILTLNSSVVSWNPISGANDYHLRVMSIDTEIPYDQYFETAATSYDLSTIGLTEAGSYSVAVWADMDDGFGESSAITYIYGG